MNCEEEVGFSGLFFFEYRCDFLYSIFIMMPGSKGLSPHELAHGWVKDLRIHPDMSIKVGGF